MSQDFKFKFDRMLESDPTLPGQEAGEPAGDARLYPSVSHTRNLGFVWPDGRRMFLNYSYLVSAEFRPVDNAIHLAFTTHEVLMKGVALHILFEELMSHLPRIIRCTEARYNATLEQAAYAVNQMAIEKAG